MTDDTEMSQQQRDAELISILRAGINGTHIEIDGHEPLEADEYDLAMIREIDRLREAAKFAVEAIDLTEDLIQMASARVTLRNARYGLEVALDPDYEAKLAASVQAIQREPVSPERLAEWKKHIGMPPTDAEQEPRS